MQTKNRPELRAVQGSGLVFVVADDVHGDSISLFADIHCNQSKEGCICANYYA